MNGISSVTDSPRPGQAHRVVTPEATAAAEAIVKENRRVTVNEMAAHLDMSHGSAHHIVRDIYLYMFKVFILMNWVGHAMRMEEGRIPRIILEWKPTGRRIRGRPRKRWFEDVEDFQAMRIRGWRKLSKERTEWKKITEKAKIHSGF